MDHQVALALKAFAADGACIIIFACMLGCMLRQADLGPELFLATITLVRFFPRVFPHMLVKLIIRLVRLSALCTHLRRPNFLFTGSLP
jgi:hypothetical protein